VPSFSCAGDLLELFDCYRKPISAGVALGPDEHIHILLGAAAVTGARLVTKGL
jgi:hypothetical protein